MDTPERPIVVGGGAAGLAACLTLESLGFAPLLLEASDRLGGRLRTDRMEDGTPVDRGFQILLTAYPELERWADIPALDPVAFVPGARIRSGTRWKTVADPRRLPGSTLATLTSGIGSFRDRLRILRLVGEACSGTAESVQDDLTTGTTLEFLRARGFSEPFIAGFLRPFFSGIFLDAALSPPPAQFMYTLRMLANGRTVRPRQGIEALATQLSGRLLRTEVRYGCEVRQMTAHAVHLVDGTEVKGAGVISTIPAEDNARWNACLNVVFECQAPTFGQPIIGLMPAAECVTNLHFMEDVQGEEGRGKVNVTALPPSGEEMEVEDMISSIRDDLKGAGLSVGSVMWHAMIRKALPAMERVGTRPEQTVDGRGVFLAGDHVAAPSLDAALRSGRLAAEAWVASKAAQDVG